MLIYSKKIIQFLLEIKHVIKEVLSKEIQLPVANNRFYDRDYRISYPIRAVVYNNKQMLGYFDSDFYELGFHECLMYTHKAHLYNTIRHELAHYMTFIEHGAAVQPHGKEFLDFCKKTKWGEEIFRATICLEGAISQQPENLVLRKVQKLMALANSANEHEAQAAMIKSQQLLLKHNIDAKYACDEEKMYLKRILKQRREDAKMRAIARILETFFVNVVYSRGGDSTYLEILGTSVNVEIAEYVASILQTELDRLWLHAQKTTRMRGQIAKNSFFLGLARGYCDKVKSLKHEYGSEMQRALLVIENQLTEAKAMAYPRLSSKRSSSRQCLASSALGEKMGRQLNINPAVQATSSGRFITST